MESSVWLTFARRTISPNDPQEMDESLQKGRAQGALAEEERPKTQTFESTQEHARTDGPEAQAEGHLSWVARRIKHQYDLPYHWATVHRFIKRHGILVWVKLKP